MEETTQRIDDTRSAFLHAVKAEEHVPPSIELFVQQLNIETGEKQTVSRVLRRVEAAISEIGYDSFLEDLSSAEFLGGNDTPVGSDAINLIPGHGKTVCCTTLLAVSQGDNKAIGFPTHHEAGSEHLIRLHKQDTSGDCALRLLATPTCWKITSAICEHTTNGAYGCCS